MATLLGELPPGEMHNDPTGVITTERKFVVQGTTADTPLSAADAVPIHRYDRHPNNSTLLATEITAKQWGDMVLGLWQVTVPYTNKPRDDKNTGTDPSQNDASVQPDLRPYLVNMHGVHREKVLGPKDLDTVNGPDGTPGAYVVNKAGDPFDPPIMRPSSNVLVTVTGWKALEAINPFVRLKTYLDTVNDADYQLSSVSFARGKIPQYCGRVNDLNYEQVFEQGAYYWKFKCDIEFNPDGWHPLKVANLGMNAKVSNALPRQPILIGGVPVRRPVPLKEDGSGPLNAGENINFCSFYAYKVVDWTNLL